MGRGGEEVCTRIPEEALQVLCAHVICRRLTEFGGFLLIVSLFLAVLGLCCSFPVVTSRRQPLVAMRRLLAAVASLGVEHGLLLVWSTGSAAQGLQQLWFVGSRAQAP